MGGPAVMQGFQTMDACERARPHVAKQFVASTTQHDDAPGLHVISP